MKICIITTYFGPWPEWMPYYLSGCINNCNLDWIFFSDNDPPNISGKNLFFHKMEKAEFSQLASNKLGFNIIIEDPYKLCDFKPAYGRVFEDYLGKYDFWGYGDIDLILGDIQTFLPGDLISNFDIISTYKGFLSGPFCLIRNNDKMNSLFEKHPDYIKIFQSIAHSGFDENIFNEALKGISLKKMKYFIDFSLSSSKLFLNKSYSLEEHNYQFQWYYKERSLAYPELMDMTDLVHFEVKKENIRVLFEELLITDLFFLRVGRKNWLLEWNNGILVDLKHNEKIFGFHFMESKKEKSFHINKATNLPDRFLISNEGIRIE